MSDTQTATSTATATNPPSAGSQFTVPPEVTEKYPDLVELIKGSASMNDSERQYWFSILPIMTADQVSRLREILTTEKQKLAEIDKKYQKQLQGVNEKHLIEWQAMKMKESKKKVAAAESQAKGGEEQQSEELLKQLGEM